MNKLIYETNKVEHYKATLYLDYIKTKDEELIPNKHYPLSTVACTSEVRRTQDNWFYILPYGIDRTKFQAWLDEFKHLFPTLKPELLPDDILEHIGIGGITTSTGRLVFPCFHNQTTGKMILLEVEATGNVGKVFIGHRTVITNLWSILVNKIGITDKYKKAIKDYVSLNENYNHLITHEIGNNYVSYDKNPDGLFQNGFNMSAVNKKSITKEKLIDYITELYENNRLYLDNFNRKDKKRLVLKVLHTKKQYKVEGYLLHHLIRAGLSQELQIFVNQYYRVKELMPDLFFWNKILLAQMGLNMYYYWWFTGARFFKLTTEKKFFEIAHKHPDDSANLFFDHFIHKYSTENVKKIVDLYKAEDLEGVCNYISETLIVELKPEKKERFVNLGLKDDYKVSHEEGDYYFIAGDDLVVRRYKKSNFKLLTI